MQRQRILAAFGLAIATLCGLASAKEPLRWAVVSSDDVRNSGLSDLLTLELGNLPRVVLVEREAIEMVLKELELNASGLVAPERAVQLGKLVAADAVLFIEHGKQRTASMLHARLIETRTGVRLEDWLLPNQGVKASVEILARELQRAARWQQLPDDDRRYVGLVGIHSEEPDSPLDETARGITVCLEHDLQKLHAVAVLEREQLRRLIEERELAAAELALRGSAYLIEGSIRRNPSRDGYQVTLKLISLGTHATQTLDLPITGTDLNQVRKTLVSQISKKWLKTPPGVEYPALETEAKIFQQRRAWFYSNMRYEEAARMAEIAMALDPSFDNLRATSSAYDPLSKPTLEGLQAAKRAHQIDLIILQQGLPSARHAFGNFRVFLDPHVDYSPTKESSRVRQARAEADELLLRKYRNLRALVEREGLNPARLLVTRLGWVDYFADTPANFADQVRQLVLELNLAAVREQMHPLTSDLNYTGYLRSLWDQLNDCCSSGPGDRHPKWEPEEFAELYVWLRQRDDPGVSIIGAAMQMRLPGDTGREAAREVASRVFAWPLETPLPDEVAFALYTYRLEEGTWNELFDSHVRQARQGTSSRLFRWPSLTARTLLEDVEDRWKSDVFALIEQGDYNRQDEPAVREMKRRFASFIRLPRGDTQPAIQGAWKNVEVRSVKLPFAKNHTPHLSAVHSVQGQDEVLLLWKSRKRFRVQRLHPNGKLTNFGPILEVPTFETKSFQRPGHGITFHTGILYFTLGSFGFAAISADRAELFDATHGAPGTECKSLAWLDGLLYVAYEPGLIYAFDPENQEFQRLAATTSLEPKQAFDGGQRYTVDQMLAHPKSQSLMLSVDTGNPNHPRQGIWRFTPAANSFERLGNDAGTLSWLGSQILINSRKGGYVLNPNTGKLRELFTWKEFDSPSYMPLAPVGDYFLSATGRLISRHGEVHLRDPSNVTCLVEGWGKGSLMACDTGTEQVRLYHIVPRLNLPSVQLPSVPFPTVPVRPIPVVPDAEHLPPVQSELEPLAERAESNFALKLAGKQFVEVIGTNELAALSTPCTAEMWVRWDAEKPLSCLMGTFLNVPNERPRSGWMILVRQKGLGEPSPIKWAYLEREDSDSLKWHHVLWTIGRDFHHRLYVDGKRIVAGSFGPDRETVSNLCLGAPILSGPEILSYTEIRAFRLRRGEHGPPGISGTFNPPGFALPTDEHTIALLDFSRPNPDRVTDLSGHGHHGKLAGAKWIKLDD